MTAPSCGSVFRNPPGHKAAALIEQCGLRGVRRGPVQVSGRHANFIVHDGGTAVRAADVEALIQHIQSVVAEKTGIRLVPEVHILGEPETGDAG